MKRDSKLYIEDILTSIELVSKYTKGFTEKKFLRSSQTQDAVLRRLEVISEAARQLPDKIKKRHPKIPWKKIVSMRTILAHEYFGVRLQTAWNTIKKDLPKLKQSLENVRNSLD